MKNNKTFVIERKEQNILMAVATELISNCKIDYYPDDNMVRIYYYGPKRLTISQHEINSTIVTKQR